jgi:hypothetical protein
LLAIRQVVGRSCTREEEPVVNLSEVLSEVYQEAALDLAIDYSVQPIPALSEGDFQWVRSLMES